MITVDVLTGLEVWVKTDPLTGEHQYIGFIRETAEHNTRLCCDANISLVDQIVDPESRQEDVQAEFPRSISDRKKNLEGKSIAPHLARPGTRMKRGRSMWTST